MVAFIYYPKEGLADVSVDGHIVTSHGLGLNMQLGELDRWIPRGLIRRIDLDGQSFEVGLHVVGVPYEIASSPNFTLGAVLQPAVEPPASLTGAMLHAPKTSVEVDPITTAPSTPTAVVEDTVDYTQTPEASSSETDSILSDSIPATSKYAEFFDENGNLLEDKVWALAAEHKLTNRKALPALDKLVELGVVSV
jgi:hypothetical protein